MINYIIGTIFGSILLVAITWLLILNYRKTRTKEKLIKQIGASAEIKVNGDIKIWAKQTKNIFIDASLYKYMENKLFEVDSIVITSKALIVVEVKSINGSVHGDANDETWTKQLYEKTFPITNAYKQNQKHIDHIIKMINTKMPVVSLIVFSNRTSDIKISNLPAHVLAFRHVDLFSNLDKIDKNLPFALNEKEMKNIRSNIIKYQTNSKVDIKKHRSFFTQKAGK